MSHKFIISPLNALDFKSVNNLMPNYANTLIQHIDYEGAVNTHYKQKLLASKPIRTHMYSNSDTIEAILVDCNTNVKTNLSVVLVKTVAADDLNEEQFWYEFTIAGQPIGSYYVTIKGIKAGFENVYFQCENFDIENGLKGYRTTADGNNLEYEYIPYHLLIEANNSVSRDSSIYWGSDRITGEPFETAIWIPSNDYKAQAGGERDTYNNLGNETILQGISQRLTELKTSPIPVFLAMKLQWLSALDYFRINNLQYVTPENGENEYSDNFTDVIVTLNLTNSFVIGVNSDDQGRAIEDTTMGGIEVKVAENVSSTDSLLITGGYALNLITYELTQGTSATVKIGITPGGNEISRDSTITSVSPIKYISKNYVNTNDLDASFTAYITVTGVAALVDVRLQTIPNSQ